MGRASLPSTPMSEPNTTPEQEPAGYGHQVEITLPNGQKKLVPWGFQSQKKEEVAAKRHGVESPGSHATED